MAHGEGAHLLEVNEGVVAVLPARCDAARSTHLPAGAARAVVSTGSKLEVPDLTRSLMRGEGASSCEPVSARLGRGQSRTSPLLGSRAQRVAEVHPQKCQSHGPPFMERGWQNSMLPGCLTMHDAVVMRCVWSRGINFSWDPAKRPRKSSEEATRMGSDEKTVGAAGQVPRGPKGTHKPV